MEPGNAATMRAIERVLLTVGVALLAFYVLARVQGSRASRVAMERFRESAAVTSPDAGAPVSQPPLPDSAVDFALWNPKRIAAYKSSLSAKTDLPIAILRIPKINLEVPVFNDTDDLTLNRGVGRILGTARIGQPGNLGIAGHRDGFFRGLKDVGPHDVVELIQPGRTDEYTIEGIKIVSPDDVSVLAPTSTNTLTLVTCFPFYYIGNAPQRYIVTASYHDFSGPDRNQQHLEFQGNKIKNKENHNEVN
jgi:sortase A